MDIARKVKHVDIFVTQSPFTADAQLFANPSFQERRLDGDRNEDSSSSAEIAPFSSSANSVHLTRPTTSSDGQKMDQVSLTLKGPSRTRNHKIQAFKL